MKIECTDVLAKALIEIGAAKQIIDTKPEPEPVPTTGDWQRLIAAISTSKMTPEMKVACLAQSCLETGYGSSRVFKECKNGWGIKMRPELEGLAVGKDVPVTSETEGHAVFAQFKTEDNAVAGWLKFLTRSYYAGWEKFQNDSSAFIRHIGKSWCPRADYADDVISLFPKAMELLKITAPESKPTPTTKRKTIVLDAGHALKEPGAHSAYGAKEEVLNLEQVGFLTEQLSKNFNVKLAHLVSNDLETRGEVAEGADLYLSCHHNSYDGNADPGTEVFVPVGANKASKDLAALICSKICDALGSANRGVKEVNYTVVKTAKAVGCPAVMLVESYFVNPYNQKEASARSAKAAAAILEAINLYYKQK